MPRRSRRGRGTRKPRAAASPRTTGPSLPPGILLGGEHARLRRLPAWIYQRAHRYGPIRQAIPRPRHERTGPPPPAPTSAPAATISAWAGPNALTSSSDQRWLRLTPRHRILVFGESMGAATAMNVAGDLLARKREMHYRGLRLYECLGRVSLQLMDMSACQLSLCLM